MINPRILVKIVAISRNRTELRFFAYISTGMLVGDGENNARAIADWFVTRAAVNCSTRRTN